MQLPFIDIHKFIDIKIASYFTQYIFSQSSASVTLKAYLPTAGSNMFTFFFLCFCLFLVPKMNQAEIGKYDIL